MKRSLLSGVAVASLLALAAPVSAADLGGYSRPPEPAYDRVPLDIERWTGFYLGAAAGYGFGDGRSRGDLGSFSFDQSGAVGSIYAGYNWQFGRAVMGVETDIGTGGMSSSTDIGGARVTTDLNAMGSFRGRAGFLMTPALLLYGTAGWAWQNMDIGVDGLGSQSQTFWGLQYGIGSELRIAHNVSLRLEYLRTDFDRETISHSGFVNSYRPDTDTVRAGVTFKF
jgi:outer membrane immunogenic protein